MIPYTGNKNHIGNVFKIFKFRMKYFAYNIFIIKISHNEESACKNFIFSVSCPLSIIRIFPEVAIIQ